MNTADKVIAVAMNEVGYLEKSKTAYKKNPNIIYDKTAGAGSDNITIYNYEMHKLYPSVMDFPCYWCASFIHWCFYKAYGYKDGNDIVYGYNDYTVASSGNYAKHNAIDSEPRVGDQVFFTKNGKTSGCYHTGLVYAVDKTYFYTIEGNTSNASIVVANGGCVAKKKYNIANYKGKVLFGHPKYETSKTFDEVVEAVRRGEYGVGNARRAKLTEEGWNFAMVQAEVTKRIREDNMKAIKNDVPRYIWTYLMGHINNPYGVAGLMGNMQAESGLNPKNLQNSFEKKFGLNDDTYTAAVDSGAYGRFGEDLAGYGLCQWSSSGRKQRLLEMRKGRSIGDIDLQLEYLIYELNNSYKGVMKVLKNAKTVKEASDYVLSKFERPKDQSDAVKEKRSSFGQSFLDKYME